MLRLLISTISPQRRWMILFTLLTIMLGQFGIMPVARGAILTVNSDDDVVDGDGCDAAHCSLREAILASNTSIGVNDNIEFNLPDPNFTISVGTGALALTDPVTIDGTTQPGASCASWPPTLLIELDGSGSALGQPGLAIDAAASGSTVRGLVINRFPTTGLSISADSANNVIECNFIGTDTTGSTAMGNGSGIFLLSDGVGNRIGGTSESARNLISGNNDEGIRFIGASNFTIQGNYIGTDVSGTAPLGNTEQGIFLDASSNNVIGGTDPNAGNIISSNGFNGIRLELNANNNVIQGNFIGTDVTGTINLANTLNGVIIAAGSSDNLIGGTGGGNVIAYNIGFGVYVFNPTSVRNEISSNSIFSNNTLGINLDNNGITPNDAGDIDTGSNNLQNFPVLATATSDDVETIITGSLDSTVDTFRVEFFSNSTCDISGNGEGEAFISATSVAVTGGVTNFSATLPVLVDAGTFITATATDSTGNTSEFSACQVVTAVPRYVSDPIDGSTISFSILQGTPDSTVIDVNNPGGANLNITDVTLSDTTNFTLMSGATFTIASGNTAISQDIDVQCNALTTVGSPFTTLVTVTHNGLTSPATYTVECDVAPPPSPNYSANYAADTEINMGTTTVGGSITEALTITNIGTGNLTVGPPLAPALLIDGANAGDFVVSTLDLPTSPGLAANDSDDVTISCTPSGLGDRTATLTLVTNDPDPGDDVITYPLRCTGAPPGPVFSSTPLTGSVIDLGSTSVGVQITDIDALVINNNGSDPLSIIFGLSGGDLNEFDIPGPGTIATGDSLDIEISCNPDVAGLRETTLQVSHNALGSPAEYTLRCTGTAPEYGSLPVPGGTINFGETNILTTVTNTTPFSITNSGTEDLDVSFSITGANAADFTMVTLDQTVAIGISLPVSITCTPGATGARVATLNVTHNDLAITNPATYMLNCTGTEPVYTSIPVLGQPIILGPSQIGSPVTNAAALVITNNGTSDLDVVISIGGGDIGDFTLNTVPTTQTISESSNLSVSLTCTPSAIGPRTTTLTVMHNAAGSPATYDVECEGLAAGVPIYFSNPAAGTPIDFGNVTINTPSTNATALVISNTGTAPMTVAFDITGGDAADFSPTPADTTVAPGIPLNVSLTCTPSVTGLRTTTLTVNHNAAGSPAIYTVNCNGTPVAVPIYDSTPLPGQSIDLGSSPVGVGVTDTDALVIRNTGGAVMNVAFSKSGTDEADFTINTANQSIAGAGTLNVSITCTPSAAVARSATLTVTHDAAGTPATYPLTCTGTTPSAPGYGSNPAVGATLTISTPPNVSGTTTLTISETGGAALTINSYSISGSAGTLSVSGPGTPFTINDGGASQALTVSCLNATPGTYPGTLTVNHNATGSPATYTVNCTVTTPGSPGFSSVPAPGSTINVGTVQIGTAISTNLLISNPGTATLLVTLPAGNILITGPNHDDFAVITNSPPFSVQPNNAQSIAVTIRCIPTIAGLEVATLTFQTNAPGLTTVSYALNCIGSGTPVLTATPIGFVATASPFVPTPTPVLPATGTVSIEVKGLAMRTGPYLGATLIGAIRPGTAYGILAQSNDESPQFIWYLIVDANNITGWVSGRFLEVTGNIPIVPFQGSIFDTIDNAPDTGVTARAMSIIDIRRRPSGRAAILGQIPQDANISIMGRTRQNGGDFWVQVRYNGIIGWIPAAPIDVHGTTQNVPIR